MLFQIIDYLFLAYTVMLFVRIFGSWFPEFRNSQWMQFVAFYTDPYLNFFRRLIPPLGMIDLSPIVALFLLNILKTGLKIFIVSII